MTQKNNLPESPVEEEKILKPMNTPTNIHKKMAPVVIIVAIVLGVLTGWFFTRGSGSALLTKSGGNTTSQAMLRDAQSSDTSSSTVVGSKDTKTFKDCTEGKLIQNNGKITTEGSHILQRPGGDSQNVYLTSSIVDLDQFLNKSIQVCGQTNQAQKAGWLLDVGLVKLK